MNGLLYGTMNALMVIPVSVSFCSIIFSASPFQPLIPKLVKLVLFSSVIHQICFSLFSSLPFAIGQVQDAGLVFLSAMATDIAFHCDEGKIVSTTLFTLSLSTFLLGALLVLVSRLRLAAFIQFLPMPVVGGYLAFIGLFCGQAGIAMVMINYFI